MLSLLLLAASVSSQLKFGVNTRLGLLGQQINKDPLGSSGAFSQTQGANAAFSQTQGANAAFSQTQGATGRAPAPQSEFVGGDIYKNSGGDQCCCVPDTNQCGDGRRSNEDLDLVGSGAIDARSKNPFASISTRIVNRPGAEVNTNSNQQSACPRGQKPCCSNKDDDIDVSVFGRTCLQPRAERWIQGCSERVGFSSGVKQCGTRDYRRPASGLDHGTSSPGEFPWTCLILNTNNDFLGSCAIIPDNSGNDNRQGTRKVITAAHKLKGVLNAADLKVRVGEWDASGSNDLERQNHIEYSVNSSLIHKDYNSRRLNNDIALLTLNSFIDLSNPYINTACLPSCRDQFDFTFQNGTGSRCWVAGWGKNEFDGSFQFLQQKVDLPLVNSDSCQPKLKDGLNGQRPRSGDRFVLDRSEICAGGVEGKDACTGDGGSPLVCQGASGRWTVVGLVTWGVGCASHIPGVYARVSEFSRWIDQN